MDGPPGPRTGGDVKILDWVCRAACRDADPDLFFPEDGGAPSRARITAAKAVCARCPVTCECLAAATADNAPGIWGGTTEAERKPSR
ncbi:MAG: WhiB family transcriptional regulator [Pseudonocardiaceae bacterium]